VYYTRNQILVTPYNSPLFRDMGDWDNTWPTDGVHFMPKIELSMYMSALAREALQHIRWLEWLLPSSMRTYLLPGTPAWHDYLDTLLVMKHAMNLPALTLTIDISSSGQTPGYCCYVEVVAMRANEDAWRWYETIVIPLVAVGEGGLKDFFVHLRWEAENSGREQELERAVMGVDYDSAERGKPVVRTLKTMSKRSC
jgi:hypothetical protein